ncbi:hypothetical protein Q5752_000568 [Cryptotrichosporon argae]
MLALALAPVASLLVPRAAAARVAVGGIAGSPLFVGCIYESIYQPENGEAYPISNVPTASDCAADCASRSYEYAYYYPGFPLCYCDHNSPTGAELDTMTQTLTGTTATYTCGQDQDWEVYVSDTTYSASQVDGLCQTTLTTDPALAYESADSIEACLKQCEEYDNAVYTMTSGASVECACFDSASTIVDASAVGTCASSSVYWLQHTAGAYVTDYGPGVAGPQASAWAKRHTRQLAMRSLAARRLACPAPATACIVGDDAASFECLDTRTELEACGGCTAGTYGDATAPVGVDCTTLPGVATDAVTCQAGQCVAYACRSGWALAANGTCI